MPFLSNQWAEAVWPFGAMDGLSGSQATTLALQLNSLFLHHSMNTYRLCFKASDILNGSVSLQFIIGLADSLADQVTKFPLPLLTITKLHPPPNWPSSNSNTHWPSPNYNPLSWSQKSKHCTDKTEENTDIVIFFFFEKLKDKSKSNPSKLDLSFLLEL